jgi:glycosyltransferase involved in cell wall biosynthesis
MESKNIKISWVIATRNRLPFLKIILDRLIPDLQQDEEILIADGNSTDGTVSFLQNLLLDGKITNFISEKDINQSHAWNKVFLMANGRYIKKLIDDDVVDFKTIRMCVNEMDKFPEADVCISNDMSMRLDSVESIYKHSRFDEFLVWKSGKVPSFTFGDVHMIIRRSSLPFIGLYNPTFHMMDYEYSLRISYLQAGILYYTGYNALSISSDLTVSSKVTQDILKQEGIRANTMWFYAGDGTEISNWSKIKIRLGKLRDKITGRKKRMNFSNAATFSELEIKIQYDTAYEYLRNENLKNLGTFVFSKK